MQLVQYYIIIILCTFRYCLAFVIVPILQKELDDFVKWWNSHRIRYNRKSDSPKGIPDDLFDIPEAVGMLI